MRVRVIARKPDGKLGEKYARRWFMSSLATAPGTYLRALSGLRAQSAILETLVRVSAARDQAALPVLDVGQ
jgi:hypothetical protein